MIGNRPVTVKESPLEGIHPQHRNIVDSVCIHPFNSELIINSLPVRPGFHEAGGNTRQHTHIGSGPFQADPRVSVNPARCHLSVVLAPPADQCLTSKTVDPVGFKLPHTDLRNFRFYLPNKFKQC